jgi:hypothetical protein
MNRKTKQVTTSKLTLAQQGHILALLVSMMRELAMRIDVSDLDNDVEMRAAQYIANALNFLEWLPAGRIALRGKSIGVKP